MFYSQSYMTKCSQDVTGNAHPLALPHSIGRALSAVVLHKHVELYIRDSARNVDHSILEHFHLLLHHREKPRELLVLGVLLGLICRNCMR